MLRRISVIGSVMTLVGFIATGANAAVSTDTTGAITQGFSDTQGVATGVVAAGAFALAVALVAIGMGLRALWKRGKSVG